MPELSGFDDFDRYAETLPDEPEDDIDGEWTDYSDEYDPSDEMDSQWEYEEFQTPEFDE